MMGTYWPKPENEQRFERDGRSFTPKMDASIVPKLVFSIRDGKYRIRLPRDREVAMLKNDEFEIEVEAAIALAGWKSVFAEQVSEQAKAIARARGKSGVITLAHYCEAATIAVQSLSVAIQDSDTRNGRQKAA